MLTQEAIQQAANQIAAAAHAPVKIILFGSYARGQAHAGSDVDFLVVENEIPDPAQEFLKLHRAASGLGAGVDILLLTTSEFEKKRDWWTTPVCAAAREGKVLYEQRA